MKTFQTIAKLTGIIILVSTLQSCYSIYHFDADEYFKNKESNKEMPFSMKAENISAPLFKPEQKVNISGALCANGCNAKIAYKPTDHLLVLFNYSSVKNTSFELNTVPVWVTTYQDQITDPPNVSPSNPVIDESTRYLDYEKQHTLKQKSWELAAGYIKELGKGSQWDAIAGGGTGTSENSCYYMPFVDPSYSALFSESRNHLKLFLQSDIGFVTKLIEGSISARFSYLNFFNREFETPYPIIQNEMDPYAFTFQPGFHFGIGSKTIRAFSEYSFIIPLNHTDVSWKNSSLSLGCAIKF